MTHAAQYKSWYWNAEPLKLNEFGIEVLGDDTNAFPQNRLCDCADCQSRYAQMNLLYDDEGNDAQTHDDDHQPRVGLADR